MCKMKKLISFFFCAFVVLCIGTITCGEEASAASINPKHAYLAETKELNVNDGSGITLTDKSGNTVSSMTPYIHKNYTTYSKKISNEYKVAIPDSIGDSSVEIKVPVTIKTTGLLKVVARDKNNEISNVSLEFVNGSDDSFYPFGTNGDYINKTGTYYIKITGNVSYLGSSDVISFYMNMVSSASLAPKPGTYSMSYVDSDKTPVYYKITSTHSYAKCSYLFHSEYSVTSTLCDKNKRPITEKSYTRSGKTITYTVGKGTYYVRFSTFGNAFGVKYNKTYISNAAGTSMSKATTLSINKSAKYATVLPTDKTGRKRYFKFYNPKTQTIAVHTYSNITSGNIKLTFYKGGKSFGSTYRRPYSNGKSYVKLYSSFTGLKLTKGTYYIAVEKGEIKTDGYISISVKNHV